MYDFYTFKYFILVIINGIIWGLVCKYIIARKGYNEEKQRSYFWIGFFLDIIGVYLAFKTSDNTYNSANAPLGSFAQLYGVWRCYYCGKTNFGKKPPFSTCECGFTRNDSKKAADFTTRLKFLNIDTVQTKNNTDMLDDLESLKKLLDRGMITQEEFDSHIAKLLK